MHDLNLEVSDTYLPGDQMPTDKLSQTPIGLQTEYPLTNWLGYRGSS